MPPLYELILTLVVFVGGLGFVAVGHADTGTNTAIIALITGIVGSFIRGMGTGSGSGSGSNTPATVAKASASPTPAADTTPKVGA